MGYFTWVDAKIKKYAWMDVGCIKLSVAGFILMIAKVWEPLLSIEWYWYGLISVCAAIKPLSVVLQK